MRRFLLRNAAGEQVGEGVEWANGRVDLVLSGEDISVTHGADSIAGAQKWLAEMVAFAGAEKLRAGGAVSIDWLDPPPKDVEVTSRCSPDGKTLTTTVIVQPGPLADFLRDSLAKPDPA